MIELINVSKSFYSRSAAVPAVDGVTLSVSRGQIFGVIGYSGAGKSTLIRLINGLERLDGGTIKVGDLEISRASERELRRARPKIGMIFQHFNLLWSRNVAGNIAFALEIAGTPRADIPGRVDELIKLVGLDGREDAYPAQLSGGQKQRVGIARALANRPEVLLCDEATSALDPETTDSILGLLSDINRRLGLTIVLITHEMHVVRRICDDVAVMDAGRVVESGPVSEVFAHPQAEVTRRFLRQLTDPEGIADSLDPKAIDWEQGALVKLTYVGPQARQAALADAIRTFDLPINILHGRLSRTRDAAIGDLYVQIPASEDRLSEVFAFLRARDIASERIEQERKQ